MGATSGRRPDEDTGYKAVPNLRRTACGHTGMWAHPVHLRVLLNILRKPALLVRRPAARRARRRAACDV